MYLFYIFFRYFFVPLGVCAILFIFIKRITKGRFGKTDYLIKIIIVSIFQVFISYSPEFIFNIYRYVYWQPYALLLFFCINIHISTKRLNDSVNEGNNNYIIYFSPIANSIIYFVYYFFTGIAEMYVFDKPRPGFLSVLIIANIIPIIVLYSKEYEIKIKKTDVPVSYRDIFRKIFHEKDKYLFEINKDCIYTDNIRFSLKHNQNVYSIISYREVDNENILIKYFKEKNIEKLGFHYHNKYYDLTDEEYNTMIAAMKKMNNVIFINYPYMVINDVNVYIRNDGTKCSAVFLKEENEKLYNEVYLLKDISKKAENEKYICYSEIKKKDIFWWVQKIMNQRQYLQLGD